MDNDLHWSTIVRQGVWTSIFTPPAAACGAVLAGLAMFGFEPIGPVTPVLGVALLMFAAAGGLLLHRFWQRGSSRLADKAAEMRRSSEIGRIAWPDDHLAPLVTALNDCLAHAASTVEEASAEARRTTIELKLTAAQRQQAVAVICSIEDAVLVTDGFDEILLANHAALALFDVDDPQPADNRRQLALTDDRRPIAELVRDQHLAAAITEMRQSGSTIRRTFEHQLDAGGATRTYRVTLACVCEEGASPAADAGGGQGRGGVVAVLRDTSREKELQQAKNDFVSGVTHELRTPLASIRAYAEMLIDGEVESDAARREYYEIIQGEADRLAALIDNILNISRIESGIVKIDRRPQSPVLLAEKALEVILPQAKLKNIQVRKELLPAIYQVEADADLLYQVILNLLSNAVKYTPAGGQVILRSEADEERGVLITKVIDNGPGISEKDLPRVFEKFYRVERNARLAKGTGLGLPLVKRVIEQDFGGRVLAESREGEGSMFGFELAMLGRRPSEGESPPQQREAA